MADANNPFSQIDAIIAGYETELRKAERDLDRAKKKLENARSQLETAKEMGAKLKEGAASAGAGTQKQSLGDAILAIVNESGDTFITAKFIHGELLAGGRSVDVAAVHVTADRLFDAGKISRGQGPSGMKVYKSLPQPQGGNDDDIF